MAHQVKQKIRFLYTLYRNYKIKFEKGSSGVKYKNGEERKENTKKEIQWNFIRKESFNVVNNIWRKLMLDIYRCFWSRINYLTEIELTIRTSFWSCVVMWCWWVAGCWIESGWLRGMMARITWLQIGRWPDGNATDK